MNDRETKLVRARAIEVFRLHCAKFPHTPSPAQCERYADVAVAIVETEERLLNLQVALHAFIEEAAR